MSETGESNLTVIHVPHGPSNPEGFFDATKYKLVAIIAGEKTDKYVLREK